jgi:hypothetical protein
MISHRVLKWYITSIMCYITIHYLYQKRFIVYMLYFRNNFDIIDYVRYKHTNLSRNGCLL